MISGYAASIKIVEGRMPAYDLQFTVIYTKKGPGTIIIDDFDPALGLGGGLLNIGDCFD